MKDDEDKRERDAFKQHKRMAWIKEGTQNKVFADNLILLKAEL